MEEVDRKDTQLHQYGVTKNLLCDAMTATAAKTGTQ